LGLNDFYFGSKEEDFPLGHIQMLGKTDAAMFRGESHGPPPGFAAGELASHALDFWLVEDRYPRPIFSSLHGLYSTGGLAAASIAALAVWGGVPAAVQALGLTVIIAPVLLAASRALLRGEVASADRVGVLAWPSRALIGLGGAGVPGPDGRGCRGRLDRGLFARMRRSGNGRRGYRLRLLLARDGDRPFQRRLGASTMGCGQPASGRRCGSGSRHGDSPDRTWPDPAVLGFTLFGLGLANMVPVLLGAAGSAQDVTAGLGIASVATAGDGGLLGGPLIGFLAEITDLRVALITILVGVLAVAVFAGSVRENRDGARGERRNASGIKTISDRNFTPTA